MNIDWDNPPSLRCPKHSDATDRERLARSKLKRRKRKPSKAHATGKRRFAIAAAKAVEAKKRRDATEAARAAYHAQARAYWRGEIDCHP